MKRPIVSVIVPNYQGRKVFPACLRSLLKQDFADFQIVFVDDSSTDGSYALAHRLFGKEERITIARTPKNSGYVGACNTGLKHAKGQYVIVTNNDATFPKDWLREMHATVKGKQNVIGSSILLNHHDDTSVNKAIAKGIWGTTTVVSTGADRRLDPLERKTGLFEVPFAGVLIIPRKALKDRIFEPEYFAYGEDIELCWRLRLRGYAVVSNSRARMHHIGGYTSKTVPAFNKRAAFHGTKNMFTNFFVFYEWKNVLRILPPLLFVEFCRGITRPRRLPWFLKAYWWVLTHPRYILRQRRKAQRARRYDDREVMRLISYKLYEENAVTPPARQAVRGLNALMRMYCKAVGLQTYDIDGPAIPPIRKSAVRKGNVYIRPR